ncbi:MAG: exodeoxyribonuclease VII small subunit [Neisseriaceae bacterium]
MSQAKKTPKTLSEQRTLSSNKELSFEAAMERLEVLTTQMQAADITLEETLKYYEEGLALTEFCQKKLEQIEQKIQILNKKSNAESEQFRLEEFFPDEN